MKGNIIRLFPVGKNYIWGGDWLQQNFHRGLDMEHVAESWELSIHPDGVSRCGDELLSSFLKRKPNSVDKKGNELPILIKYIDAKNNLSTK